MNIGPIYCGGCGTHHLPGSQCMGTITFGPAVDPLPWRTPLPTLSEPSKVEQKLDRIIELLEQLVDAPEPVAPSPPPPITTVRGTLGKTIERAPLDFDDPGF
jgi:hypothetical protein